MFIDKVEVYLKAGNGGHGAVAFRREKYVPDGGPAGGDGGRGGDVIFVVDSGLRTLMDFRYKRKHVAQNGENGGNSKMSGKDGKDLIIKVPPGTLVKDKESGRIIADLVETGEEKVIAKGGKGGRGNQHFATSTRQAPRFAEGGVVGQERSVVLELKLLADVGLLGFPNVGKSTFLAAVTKARPKIADYHFTTLTPNLGVVQWKGGNSFVMADIPGIIEGAHQGTGLGHQFLRHVERTKLLIHVLDASGIEGRDPIEDFDTINGELIKYNEKLAQRRQIVALNKIDLIPEEEQEETWGIKRQLEEKGFEVYLISAATKKDIDKLLDRVIELLDEIGEVPSIFEEEEIEDSLVAQQGEKNFTVRKENNQYMVEGPDMERLIHSVNFEDIDSIRYFQRMLRKMGIIEELEKMGIQDGDIVAILDIEFEFFH
ncbi:GTPase ObgE [Irregularibacter muris]|uniref:GTPase Obg n=1 Tax=Irregularibacter muris TaxID=1796619 RepID=A0AAE3L0N5_9FIRM|nr:GTPase ObgE [Irregularibacter muris]MCR1900227.1 GTPase ObgE [Irregularibacter muris]